MNDEMAFAVVGAGGFARFAVAQFIKRPGVRLVAALDRDPAAIEALRTLAPQLKAFDTLDQLLADPGVALVYIASPPALHFEQSLAALQAGKHVICEKPAALNSAQAQTLVTLAHQQSLLYVVNLMQRYNPLFDAVKTLVQAQTLGAFVHGYFENYASDEFLSPSHWFWDQAQSGGIFIEHGVHFFDLFEGWLGRGELMAAQTLGRPGHPQVRDIAQCAVLHAGQAPVHHHHAFNQPTVLDRQTMRLQFERGDITLHDWVPTRAVLHAVCTHGELALLKALFPGAGVRVLESFDALQTCQGRFKPVHFHQKIELDTGCAQSKTDVYEGLVRAMFDDQLRWLADRSVARKITADNALRSLAMAEQAEHMALRF